MSHESNLLSYLLKSCCTQSCCLLFSKIPDWTKQVQKKWDVSALCHIATYVGVGAHHESRSQAEGLPAQEKRGCGRSGQMCQTEWLPPETACRLQSVSTWLRRNAVAFLDHSRFSFRAHRLDTPRSWLVFLRCFWSLESQWEHARQSLLPVNRKAWKK